jgi:hypothetical protein
MMSSSMRDGANAGPERSLGELFSDMTSELSLLVRKEMELARAETKEELRKAGTAAGGFGGAEVAGYMALVLASFAAAWGLAEVMAAGWAFLIVGALYGIAAALLFIRARDQMRQVSPVPEQTIDTLKEDVQWAKARKS